MAKKRHRNDECRKQDERKAENRDVGWSNANCVRDNWATDYESVESRGFIEVLRCPGPPVVRRMGLGFSQCCDLGSAAIRK